MARGLLSEHDEDPFAHGAALLGVNTRLSGLERWRWFISGGLAILALELTGLGGLLLFHLGLI